MNTAEIWNALASNKLKNSFKGVSPLDKIPRIIKQRPASIIVYTDKSNKTHWLALYSPTEGHESSRSAYTMVTKL